MKKVSLLVLALALSLVLAACGGGESTSGTTGGTTNSNEKSDSFTSNGNDFPTDFTFGAATVGGFWYTLAGAMGEEIQNEFSGSSVTIVEGGSISNILGLQQGIYQIAFSNGQTVPEALGGIGEFTDPVTNMSTIATLYPNVLHIVVPKNSDIYSVKDLAGKRVSPGIKGYSGELAFIDILNLYGMSYDDLAHIEYIGTADGGELMRDGHIDAIVGLLAAPVSTIQELDTTLGVRLIPIDKEIVEKLHEVNPGFLNFTIKGGTYSGVAEDVQTVAGFTVLLANNDLINEETGYKLAKLVVENQEKWSTLSNVMKDFNAEYSVVNNVGDLHPGAERYYREIGAIN